MDGVGITVDDLGPDVDEVIHEHEDPIILVGTEFSSMHEFRMSFQHFCIKGEFDVHRLKNTSQRYEAVCRLKWKNGQLVVPCLWRIAARALPMSKEIRVSWQ